LTKIKEGVAVIKTIIDIKNFTYRYPRTKSLVLKDINVEIKQGEFVGIVGHTGAGKTTLCMAMCGLIPKVLGGKYEGEILINGKSTENTDINELIYSASEKKAFVGITFQDPEAQIVGMTVEEDLAFGPENLGVKSEEIQERVQWVLELIRMENYRKAFPYKLSGGQKQRVGIGSTMALRPQAIILDEPTSELDPVGRYEVLSVIRELKEQNLSVIIVEHNTEELMNFVDRIIVLNDGEILMDDETTKVFREVEMLRSIGVRPPDSVEFLDRLFKLGLISQLYDSFDEQSLINNLVDNVRKAKQ